MSLTGDQKKKLATVLNQGLEACAERLGKVTHSGWSLDRVTVTAGSELGPDSLPDDTPLEHFGTFLQTAGASFLILFPPRSGYLVTNAFTRDAPEKVERMTERDSKALAETANIVANSMVAHLAKTSGRRLLISAPEMLVDRKRGLFFRALGRLRNPARLAATVFAGLSSRDLFDSECAILVFLDDDLVGRLLHLLRG